MRTTHALTFWGLALLLAGCSDSGTDTSPDAETTPDATVTSDATNTADVDATDTAEPRPAVAPTPGALLIEEFYYSGASPAGGADHYFSDQFIELVNASPDPLDLSGVLVADVYGAAGAINPGMEPDSYATSHPDAVVLESVWRIPDGTRLEPGAQLIIAHDGTNHRPFSTIDLSGAGFETYVAGSGRDADHPTVPNLESVLYNGGFDWLLPVFGASIVILAPDTTLGTEPGPFGELATAPAASVLDTVDGLMDADSVAFKRIPASIDAGFAWVDGTYVGQSLHRKKVGDSWQDTDDTGADFESGAPNPGLPTTSSDITGEPRVELGTGALAFTALADDDDIPLIEGLQGGWHLDVSLRFSGFGPDGVLLVYEALNTSAERVSFTTQTELQNASVLEDGEDAWVRVGDRVVMDIASAAEVVDQTLVLRVTTALGDQTWSDERRVRVVAR